MTRAMVQASRLAQVTGFSDAVINLVAQTVAKDATRLELAWFLYNARRLDVDPILGEIHLVKYDKRSAGQIVPGIALYRKQAEDSGVYAGSDRPEFEYDDPDSGRPTLARVTVYKVVEGMRCPFVGEARWVEEYPGDGPQGAQYRKRPWNQLAVRAESRALRKGFPRQTRALDVHQSPPEDWQAAAYADERHSLEPPDPEVIKRNAALYDRIFGEPEEPAVETPAAPSEAAAPAAPGADAAPSGLADLWGRNRQLMAEAYSAGIRLRELPGNAGADQLRQRNQQIEEALGGANGPTPVDDDD